MDVLAARNIATYTYLQARDRFGEPIIEHVARVAAAVPPEARATAWLHDAFEVGCPEIGELRHAGISTTELEALELLTRAPTEVYELYALRIAHAAGEAGRLARAVKLADLDDHLAHHPMPPNGPPYAWARRHIAIARARRHETDAAEQIAV